MSEPLSALLVGIGLSAMAAILLWPNRGVYARWRRAREQTVRVRIEDALKHIYGSQMTGDRCTLHSLGGALQLTGDQAAELLLEMEGRGLLEMEGDLTRLTMPGRETARHIIRAHRLWERYLADETGFEELEWHGRAERHEHRLTPEEADSLAARLGNPIHDPHGDPIPDAEGEIQPEAGMPLTFAEMDVPLRIVHLEDEPRAVYAQLLAEGLYPGMEVRLIDRSVRFLAGGEEHVLAPLIAANISVDRRRDDLDAARNAAHPLSDLATGERGHVAAIAASCRGLERRRLLDLGVLPGTEIQAEFCSPGHGATAYRIRDALIALRKEQADNILIHDLEASA